MTVTGRNAVKRDKANLALMGLTALPLILAVGIYVAYFAFMDWVPMVDSVKEAGFGQGLLNGYFAVPTLFVSLFNDDWTVYAPVNNGNSYAFGFLLGLVLIHVGARRIASKR